ncbi:unnamed protein product [Linum tenue]|uniref:Uncharacterized protein n=1 Tax=Linum tenue TaxID=586396 RepID=A0AAV0NUZ0_9ROSI|nr:unnamed protein product [Linum tenue]CAI0462490.1 unnamed protein product [Linum tenue]
MPPRESSTSTTILKQDMYTETSRAPTFCSMIAFEPRLRISDWLSWWRGATMMS